jgi:hypothetical protein
LHLDTAVVEMSMPPAAAFVRLFVAVAGQPARRWDV